LTSLAYALVVFAEAAVIEPIKSSMLHPAAITVITVSL
jgi:hypothetical protein